MSAQTPALRPTGVEFLLPAKSSDWRISRRARRGTSDSPRDSGPTVEKRIIRVESILILITVAAIAYGDSLVGQDISLGYLYLVPLSYCALTQRLQTTLGLLVVCVALRQWLGPLDRSSWTFFVRDWALAGIFAVLVTTLQRLGQERRRLFERARSQRDELVREVQMAAQVQRNLLSKNLPPVGDYEIAAHMSPAKVVGGDYYDFIALEDGRTGIVIADVAGKGLPAALLMPAVKIALRAVVARHEKAEDIVRELNTVLHETVENACYATIFYGSLDTVSGHFRYTNAGHLPALLVQAETGEDRWFSVGGYPVGLLPGATYEAEEISLRPGDTLVLYTDGVAEAENQAGEQFGVERLASVVRAKRHLPSSEIVAAIGCAVDDFHNGRPLDDDLTVIVIKVPHPASPEETTDPTRGVAISSMHQVPVGDWSIRDR